MKGICGKCLVFLIRLCLQKNRYNEDRFIFDATEVFVEAGDWFVHQMVHGKSTVGSAPPHSNSSSNNHHDNHDHDHNDRDMVLHRASCQAGFKGCWGGPLDGFPSANTWNKASGDGLFGTRLRYVARLNDRYLTVYCTNLLRLLQSIPPLIHQHNQHNQCSLATNTNGWASWPRRGLR